MLKTQHPGFETFLRGTHGRNDVSCSDCHMPKMKPAEGRRFTNHNIGNPFDNFEASCGRCHEQGKATPSVDVHHLQPISKAPHLRLLPGSQGQVRGHGLPVG